MNKYISDENKENEQSGAPYPKAEYSIYRWHKFVTTSGMETSLLTNEATMS